MRWLEAAYPENARGWVGFNVPMSHKVGACTDAIEAHTINSAVRTLREGRAADHGGL